MDRMENSLGMTKDVKTDESGDLVIVESHWLTMNKTTNGSIPSRSRDRRENSLGVTEDRKERGFGDY